MIKTNKYKQMNMWKERILLNINLIENKINQNIFDNESINTIEDQYRLLELLKNSILGKTTLQGINLNKGE